jgi:hypothetical protein
VSKIGRSVISVPSEPSSAELLAARGKIPDYQTKSSAIAFGTDGEMGREIVGGGIYADPDTKRLFIDLKNVSFGGERRNLLAVNRLAFAVSLPSFLIGTPLRCRCVSAQAAAPVITHRIYSTDASKLAMEISPFTADYAHVIVERAETHAIVASGVGLRGGAAGEPATFILTAKSANGRSVRLDQQGAEIEAFVTFADEQLMDQTVPISVRELSNCTYSCQYLTTNAGSASVHVKLHGKHICGSPFGASIKPAPADVAMSIARGAALVHAKVAEESTFVIDTFDRYGNRRTVGGLRFDLKLVHVQQNKSSTVGQVFDNKDGSYRAFFTPIHPGDYTLHLSSDGIPIQNSPFRVLVANSVAGKCTADGDGLCRAALGVTAAFSVTVRTLSGELSFLSDPAELVAILVPVNATSTPQGPILGVVSELEKGRYMVLYNPTKSAGPHTLHVTLRGEHIVGSPFSNVVVSAGPLSISHCMATGDGLQTAVCGSEAEFSIRTFDEYRNALCVGGVDFELVVLHKNNDMCTTIGSIHDLKNGTYAATYTPVGSGLHEVHVSSRSVPIHGSPFMVTVKGPDAKSTTAHGPGLEDAQVGVAAFFEVTSKSADGQPASIPEHSLNLSVLLSRDAVLSAKSIVHPGEASPYDGRARYSCTYTPTIAKYVYIHVLLQDTEIHGSPFMVNVTPGELFGPLCRAHGTGLEQAVYAQEANCFVQAADRYGNPLNVGGAGFTAQLNRDDCDAIDALVRDHSDGTYTISYVAPKRGPWSLHIKDAEGLALHGSPFHVQVHGAHPAMCRVTGAGLKYAAAGEEATFCLHAQTDGGAIVALEDPATQLLVKLTSGSLGPSEDVGEASAVLGITGTYTVSYTPTRSGKGTLAVLLAGVHIAGSPFPVLVSPGPAVAAKCAAAGLGLDRAVVMKENSFVMQAADLFGNLLESGGSVFDVAIECKGQGVHAQVIDKGNGQYQVVYIPTHTGVTKIAIWLGGEHISNSPFAVEVVGAVASMTTAGGAGLLGATAGEVSSFEIAPRTATGEAAALSAEAALFVSVSLGGTVEQEAAGEAASVDGRISRIGSTLYIANYTAKLAGVSLVSVTLEGSHIAGSPWSVPVVPNVVHAASCRATGPGIESATVCQRAEFEIQALDRFGNTVCIGGEKFSVRLQGQLPHAGKLVSGQIVDRADGTYAASYTAVGTGEHLLSVLMGGEHIDGSPFVLQVCGAVAATSFATGLGLRELYAGSPAAMSVMTRTATGNPVQLTSPAAQLRVCFEGHEVTITEVALGEYAVHFVPSHAGQCHVDVLLHDAPVNGSPFTVSVLPGEMDLRHCLLEGSGIATAIVQQPASFTIATADRCGNRLTQGGASFDVMVSSEKEQVKASVSDQMDGTYVVAFVVRHTGEYQVPIEDLSVPFQRTHLSVSIFHVSFTHHSRMNPCRTAVRLRLFQLSRCTPPRFAQITVMCGRELIPQSPIRIQSQGQPSACLFASGRVQQSSLHRRCGRICLLRSRQWRISSYGWD